MGSEDGVRTGDASGIESLEDWPTWTERRSGDGATPRHFGGHGGGTAMPDSNWRSPYRVND